MKKGLVILFCVAFQSLIFGQSALIQAGIIEARIHILDENYHLALQKLESLRPDSAQEAQVLWLKAACFYELERYKEASVFMTKSLANRDYEPEAEHLLMAGRVFHSVAQLDLAITYYKKYRDSGRSGMLKKGEIDKLIAECYNAKHEMAIKERPDFILLGKGINTEHDEYAPLVHPNEQTMYFISRRPQAAADSLDGFVQHERAYESKLGEITWEDPKLMVFPPGHEDDLLLCISADAQEQFLYHFDEKHAGQIYHRHFDSKKGEWTIPIALPNGINSDYFEGSVSLSPDGNTLYFISARPKGFGEGDIWKVERNKNAWGEAINLGPAINTKYDEKFVYMHPDGKTLYFASKGHDGLGSYDLYRSVLVNGEFTRPVNLGYPINSVNEESTFCLSGEGSYMWLSSVREYGHGGRDIYRIDLSKYPIDDARFKDPGMAYIEGNVLNTFGEKLSNVLVSFTMEGDSNSYSVVSNNEGSYLLVVPIGAKYLVQVAASGYKDYQEYRWVKPDPMGGRRQVIHYTLIEAPVADGETVQATQGK